MLAGDAPGRVRGARNSTAAIAAAEHGHFDAICVDLSLGDGTGNEGESPSIAAGLALLPELVRRQPDAGVIAMSVATEAAAIVLACALCGLPEHRHALRLAGPAPDITK